MHSRVPLVVGNWKMYKTQRDSVAFIWDLLPKLQSAVPSVWLAVPFTAIQIAVEVCKTMKDTEYSLSIGAQNMHDALEGAYTGEISAGMLKEAGAEFVILGHSERRQYFSETNSFINRKVKRAFEQKLRPIFCLGETKEERDQGKAFEVVQQQLFQGLEGIDAEQAVSLIVAYEPVWAIGTGVTATPAQVQEMHHFLRGLGEKKWGKTVSDQIFILYGGSVKPENVESLVEQKDVDGFLVGGASLVPDTFARIISILTKRS